MSDSEPNIEFFFDIGSPYSYLAAVQMEGLAERSGLQVVWQPFLLGAVFKATGNRPPATVAAKARWMLGDLSLQADQLGVPFQMPAFFPINSLLPQRALLAAGRTSGQNALRSLALALFEAYWGAGEDVSQPETLARCAEEVGLSPDALMRDAVAQANKDALKALTGDAISRGAFGAPTFFFQDQMFWGNDRIPLLESILG